MFILGDPICRTDLNAQELNPSPFLSGDAGHSNEDRWVSTLFDLEEVPVPDTLSEMNSIMPMSHVSSDHEQNPGSRLYLMTSDMPAPFSDNADIPSHDALPAQTHRRRQADYIEPPDQYDNLNTNAENGEDRENLTLAHPSAHAIQTSSHLLKTHKGLCFPQYVPPACHSDTAILSFINEAAKEHQQCRFDTGRPSLQRLLANMPADCLSFRLFHYIFEMPAPMQNLLAVFWVQYLFLRVCILGDAPPDLISRHQRS